MVFYILTAVVFIAELVIAIAIMLHLLRLDKMFCEYGSLIKELQPKIKEIMELCTKISEQMLEFAPIIVNNIKSTVLGIILGQIKNLVTGLTFWIVKREVQKHFEN